MRTKTKGWFLVFIKAFNMKIPIALRYEDSYIEWYCCTMTTASDGVEKINKKFQIYFPTIILKRFQKTNSILIQPLGKGYWNKKMN